MFKMGALLLKQVRVPSWRQLGDAVRVPLPALREKDVNGAWIDRL